MIGRTSPKRSWKRPAKGYGDVYRAKDLKLGRDVAIKVLMEAVASDPLLVGGAVGSDIAIAHIVSHDQHDVGTLFGRDEAPRPEDEQAREPEAHGQAS